MADEYVKLDDVLQLLNRNSITKTITFSDGISIYESVQNLPTADVVPKSEVDRAYQRGFERGKKDNVCGFSAEEIAQKAEKIAIELEAMRMAANSYKMHCENARVEVAREIFEEIEKKVKASLTVHLEEINKEHIKDTPLYDRHSGIIFAMQGMDDFIAELKKKYTEGENEDQRGSN